MNELVDATGWKPFIQPIIELAKVKDIKILQIKEKFGQLRVYSRSDDVELDAMIAQAEKDCAVVCIQCGKGDQQVRAIRGWLSTLCDECFKQNEESNK